MTEFKRHTTPVARNSDRVSTNAPHVSDLSLDQIEAYVRHGRHLRNAYIAEQGRQMFQSFASIFRRPGRLAVPPAQAKRHAV